MKRQPKLCNLLLLPVWGLFLACATTVLTPESNNPPPEGDPPQIGTPSPDDEGSAAPDGEDSDPTSAETATTDEVLAPYNYTSGIESTADRTFSGIISRSDIVLSDAVTSSSNELLTTSSLITRSDLINRSDYFKIYDEYLKYNEIADDDYIFFVKAEALYTNPVAEAHQVIASKTIDTTGSFTLSVPLGLTYKLCFYAAGEPEDIQIGCIQHYRAVLQDTTQRLPVTASGDFDFGVIDMTSNEKAFFKSATETTASSQAMVAEQNALCAEDTDQDGEPACTDFDDNNNGVVDNDEAEQYAITTTSDDGNSPYIESLSADPQNSLLTIIGKRLGEPDTTEVKYIATQFDRLTGDISLPGGLSGQVVSDRLLTIADPSTGKLTDYLLVLTDNSKHTTLNLIKPNPSATDSSDIFEVVDNQQTIVMSRPQNDFLNAFTFDDKFLTQDSEAIFKIYAVGQYNELVTLELDTTAEPYTLTNKTSISFIGPGETSAVDTSDGQYFPYKIFLSPHGDHLFMTANDQNNHLWIFKFSTTPTIERLSQYDLGSFATERQSELAVGIDYLYVLMTSNNESSPTDTNQYQPKIIVCDTDFSCNSAVTLDTAYSYTNLLINDAKERLYVLRGDSSGNFQIIGYNILGAQKSAPLLLADNADVGPTGTLAVGPKDNQFMMTQLNDGKNTVLLFDNTLNPLPASNYIANQDESYIGLNTYQVLHPLNSILNDRTYMIAPMENYGYILQNRYVETLSILSISDTEISVKMPNVRQFNGCIQVTVNGLVSNCMTGADIQIFSLFRAP